MLIYKIRSKFYYANSIEPKHRCLAQHRGVAEKSEPLWLKDEIWPNGKESGFEYCTANRFAEITVLRTAFLYTLRGMSHTVTSRDFVCQSPNQNPPQEADLLFGGLSPPIPRKGEMILWGKIYESPCVSRQKKKIKTINSPKMRAEHNRICPAKSVRV